jgi:hypothetical protein
MSSAKEYRQRAEECLQLANEAAEIYVKVALTELAAEFQKTADSLDPDGNPAGTRKPPAHRHS